MKRIIIDRNDKEQTTKNINEIEIFKQLNHINLIHYFDSFIHKDKLCIVMEYADDGDLNAKIQSHYKLHQYIPEKTIMNWFLQLCSGLHYLHSKKIIHRDIKSQNVFMMKNGCVKLGDFGISKILKNTNDFARTSLGTPYFLSPEICSGKSYNFKSDIWMLGCVLYEMATLQKPFDGENLPLLMHNILTKDYVPIPKEYSDNLKGLVAKLLDKDSSKRPSIGDIIAMPFVKEIIDEEKIYFSGNNTISVCISPVNINIPKNKTVYYETNDEEVKTPQSRNSTNSTNSTTNINNNNNLHRVETKQDNFLSIPFMKSTPTELLKKSSAKLSDIKRSCNKSPERFIIHSPSVDTSDILPRNNSTCQKESNCIMSSDKSHHSNRKIFSPRANTNTGIYDFFSPLNKKKKVKSFQKEITITIEEDS